MSVLPIAAHSRILSTLTPVVHGALAHVPRVEVAGHDHGLVRPLEAFYLHDAVPGDEVWIVHGSHRQQDFDLLSCA